MKRKNILSVLILMMLLMAGCGRNKTQTPEVSKAPETAVQPAEPSSAATPSGAGTGLENDADMISSDQAKAIALEHAGLTEDQVTIIKCELDKDPDEVNYDVEFYTADRLEYDYEIDAYTGRILGYDLDGYNTATGTNGNNQINGETVGNNSADVNGNNGAEANTIISEEEAKKIALDQVPGATDEDFLEFGRDFDDGILRYEVEILYDQKEYEFDIDARDGSILKWDKY